jgi:hypothetical protein
MDEKKVKEMIKKEMDRREKSKRFGLQNSIQHTHDGDNSPRIPDPNLDRNPAVLGSVTFGTLNQDYTFRLNMPYTPRRIHCNGLVYNPDSGNNIRIITVGEAYLGKGFYLQPETSNSVIVGDIQYPAPTEQPDGSVKNVPLQCSSWFWANRSDNDQYFASVSENHIVSVSFSGTTYARITVTDFSKDKIVFSVPFLESGYEVIANFLIT